MDIHYHSGDFIDSVKRPAVLILASHIISICNHCRDRNIDNKKRSSNPETTLAMKMTSTKDPDWEVVYKTLTLQDKMKLIRDRKCLWWSAPIHTFKECKKGIFKQPIRTAAQVLSLQHTSKPVIAKYNY